MRTREEFRQMLLSKTSIKKLYFQPPETQKIEYPCIIYKLNHYDVVHADDLNYKELRAYTVTLIDKDPDSVIPVELIRLPYSGFDRFYTADNLNHWVYTIYV